MVKYGFLFGLVCMVTFGISNVTTKKALLRENPYKVGVFIHFFTALTLLCFTIGTGTFAIPNKEMVPLFMLTTLIGSIAILSLYKGYSVGKVSLLSPIMNSAVMVTVLLAVLFYREFLALTEVWGIILAVVGIILISIKWSQLRRLSMEHIPGLRYAFLTMIGWGLYFFLLKPLALEWGALLTATYLETAIFLCLLGYGAFREELWSMQRAPFFYALLTGALVALGSLFFNLGIMVNRVSVVMTLAQAALLVTVLLSFVWLKENIEKNQLFAIGFIMAGLLLLSLEAA